MDFSSKHETNIWIFSIIVYISICMAFPLFPWFCGYSKNQVLLTVKTVNHTNPISWCIYAWCTYDCIRMGWENALLKVFVKWVYIWNKNLTSIVVIVIRMNSFAALSQYNNKKKFECYYTKYLIPLCFNTTTPKRNWIFDEMNVFLELKP